MVTEMAFEWLAFEWLAFEWLAFEWLALELPAAVPTTTQIRSALPGR